MTLETRFDLSPVPASTWLPCETLVDDTLADLAGTVPDWLPPISWMVESDPDIYAFCEPPLPEGGVCRVVISSGAIIRLWVGLLSAMYCYDHAYYWPILFKGNRESPWVLSLLMEVPDDIKRSGVLQGEAAILNDRISTLADLRARASHTASQLKADAGGEFEKLAERASAAFLGGILDLVLHEVQHLHLGHTLFVAQVRGEFVSQGLEYQAEYSAGKLLATKTVKKIYPSEFRRLPTLEVDGRLRDPILAMVVLAVMFEPARRRRLHRESLDQIKTGAVPDVFHPGPVARFHLASTGFVHGLVDVMGGRQADECLQLRDAGYMTGLIGLFEWSAGLLGSAPIQIERDRIMETLNALDGWLLYERPYRVIYQRAVSGHLRMFVHFYNFVFGGGEHLLSRDELREHAEALVDFRIAEGFSDPVNREAEVERYVTELAPESLAKTTLPDGE